MDNPLHLYKTVFQANSMSWDNPPSKGINYVEDTPVKGISINI
ncbi:unnamed protein product [marine sediment metagenome]|uniref:Uncharacterized protein n=1 Tax=marine sediment metagenome TaxID=412755 RepID=X1KJW6_9ZZZZ